jgi:hypothetical protein
MRSENDDLTRAIQALTIFDVWARAAREGDIITTEAVPQRDGLVKSPFREDGRRGSFSICHGGRGFKDFGGNGESKGGVWQFAQLCWPTLTKRELAVRLIEISGITLTPITRSAPGSVEQSAAAVSPALDAAAKALARREKLRAAEESVYAEREKLLAPRVEAKPVPTWPDFVRDRYEAGERRLLSATAVASKLAQERGWDPCWVLELAHMGLISYSLERWCEEGGREVRQKAFRVDVPDVKLRGKCDDPNPTAVATLRPVGYHQRFFRLGANGEPATKGWLYVPSVPKGEAKTQFEKALVAHGERQGVTAENHSGLIPPLPFVMGDVGAARLIVILEGQWDAITFFGACGFFQDATPPVGVAVFGLRGAQGVDVFLAYWQFWLRWNKPVAWVIADNDRAGKAWLEPQAAKGAALPPPSFAERLRHLGCRDVKLSTLKPGPWGKDFNDYYRFSNPKPTPEKMRAWMQRVGIAPP